MYKSNYGIALGVCEVAAGIGWILVVLGLLLVVRGVLSYNGIFNWFVGTGGLVSVNGFLFIMGAQVTRATIDNADHTREILALLTRESQKQNPEFCPEEDFKLE